MATITASPSISTISYSETSAKSGTMSWTKPTVPSGATISSCKLTGTCVVSASSRQVTVTVNGTTVANNAGSGNYNFEIDLGTSNNTTSVTVTAAGSQKQASGTVSFSNLVYTVEYTLDIPVTGITLSPTNITVQQNKSVIVNAILTPNGSTDEIIWSINDTNIATLTTQASSTQIGINGKTVGEATITATTVKSGISVSEKVTVEPLMIEAKFEVYLFTGVYGNAAQGEKITNYSSIIDVDYSGTGEFNSLKPLNINIINKTYSLYEIQNYNNLNYSFSQLYSHKDIHNNKYIAEYSFNDEVTLEENCTLRIYLFQGTFETETSYTVIFKDWDGTVLKTQTVEEGSSATAPSNPSRVGYNFTGWDKSFNNITSDLTVIAQYEIDRSGLTSDTTALAIEYGVEKNLVINVDTLKISTDLSSIMIKNSQGDSSKTNTIFDWRLKGYSPTLNTVTFGITGTKNGTEIITVYDPNGNAELHITITVSGAPEEDVIEWTGIGTVASNLSSDINHDNYKINIDWDNECFDVVITDYALDLTDFNYSTIGELRIGDESYVIIFDSIIQLCNLHDEVIIRGIEGNLPATLRFSKNGIYLLENDIIVDQITDVNYTSNDPILFYNSTSYKGSETKFNLIVNELPNEEPEDVIPVEKTVALRPISATQDSGYNNTWTNIANTYDTDTSTNGTIIVTGSSQSGFKRKYVDTLFNFDNPIPANATINSAVLTIRAKQSATTNLNITVSIGSDEVIGSTLLSSSSANYTADVANYVKDLNQLNINLTSAATSNRTFTLYDVRVDVNYTAYEMPKPIYTVTFKDWDGFVFKVEEVEEGSSATAPSNPTREGYTFIGWDVAFDNIISDLTVTAQYEEITAPDNPVDGMNNIKLGSDTIEDMYIGDSHIIQMYLNGQPLL